LIAPATAVQKIVPRIASRMETVRALPRTTRSRKSRIARSALKDIQTHGWSDSIIACLTPIELIVELPSQDALYVMRTE
jgi:hypothetical protein